MNALTSQSFIMPSCRLLATLFFVASILTSCGDDAATAPLELLEQRLKESKEKWERMNPHNYTYEFRWRCYCVHLSQRWAVVTVRNDTVTQVMDVESEEFFGDEDVKEYMIIDRLFDYVEANKNAQSITAIFSPNYGIPTDVYIDYRSGYGDERGFEAKKLMIN